jgi:hypothetical protein
MDCDHFMELKEFLNQLNLLYMNTQTHEVHYEQQSLIGLGGYT